MSTQERETKILKKGSRGRGEEDQGGGMQYIYVKSITNQTTRVGKV
jgi:hypothetical protein